MTTGLEFAFHNPIQDRPFWGLLRNVLFKKAPIPKICDIYPTMIKIGAVIPSLKKIQKIYKSRDTLFEFC